MFSLRHVASRFAPRNMLSLSTKFNRVAVNAMVQMPTRTFSDFSAINSGAAKLSKALEKEIKYEGENYSQLEDIETFLQESGFAFSETEESTNMVLSKEIGNKKIEVVFEAR